MCVFCDTLSNNHFSRNAFFCAMQISGKRTSREIAFRVLVIRLALCAQSQFWFTSNPERQIRGAPGPRTLRDRTTSGAHRENNHGLLGFAPTDTKRMFFQGTTPSVRLALQAVPCPTTDSRTALRFSHTPGLTSESLHSNKEDNADLVHTYRHSQTPPKTM